MGIYTTTSSPPRCAPEARLFPLVEPASAVVNMSCVSLTRATRALLRVRCLSASGLSLISLISLPIISLSPPPIIISLDHGDVGVVCPLRSAAQARGL